MGPVGVARAGAGQEERRGRAGLMQRKEPGLGPGLRGVGPGPGGWGWRRSHMLGVGPGLFGVGPYAHGEGPDMGEGRRGAVIYCWGWGSGCIS